MWTGTLTETHELARNDSTRRPRSSVQTRCAPAGTPCGGGSAAEKTCPSRQLTLPPHRQLRWVQQACTSLHLLWHNTAAHRPDLGRPVCRARSWQRQWRRQVGRLPSLARRRSGRFCLTAAANCSFARGGSCSGGHAPRALAPSAQQRSPRTLTHLQPAAAMLARTAQVAAQRWAAAASTAAASRGFAAAAAADGPKSNQYPPPDPSRLGTADL